MVKTVDLSIHRSPRDPEANWNSLPPRVEVIAIDPGETTGWAYMSIHPDALINPQVKVLDNIILHTHGQVDCGALKGNLGKSPQKGVSNSGENAGISDILKLLRTYPGAFVIIEDFIPRQFNQARHFLSPVRIGKVLDWWLWTQNRNYVFQSASEAKSTATDDRLKYWKGKSTGDNGLYQPGSLVHARDADRHAITWIRKAVGGGQKARETREFCWPHLYSEGRPFGVNPVFDQMFIPSPVSEPDTTISSDPGPGCDWDRTTVRCDRCEENGGYCGHDLPGSSKLKSAV